MFWHVGTSGFSYKEWKGDFYPADLKDSDMLRCYAGQLGCVEINNTFYRLPKRDVLRGWRSQTPEGFQFVVKASRRITHFKRLKDAEVPMGYLMENVKVLEDRLGAILFQLPPNLRADAGRLARFVELIPDEVSAAFEFRHLSWFEDPLLDILRERNFAVCHADVGESGAPMPFASTADWGYLRLRQPAYKPGDLANWIDTAGQCGWRSAHVFFKHETDGAGPRLALEFVRQAGASPVVQNTAEAPPG